MLFKSNIFFGKRSLVYLGGDRCTKFFHNYAKIKRAQSFIHSLNIDGHMVEDPQVIADHILSYYKTLYSSTDSCEAFAGMASIVPSLVTEDDNSFLTTIPSDDEIKNDCSQE